MIVGILHKGSGAGDQLFSYIATRVRAADLGVPFGFVGQEFFKCKDFMSVEWGEKIDIPYHIEEMTGRLIPLNDWPIYDISKPYFDPEFNFIPDNSMINGYGAQSEQYWGHRLNEIKSWLAVEGSVPDDICVCNLRGGEFKLYPDLFLPIEYWQTAMDIMKSRYPKIRFVVHTDDEPTALEMFKGIPVISNIELNWKAVRQAKHLILSNSAFGIIPALLGDAKEIIAPRGWTTRNNFKGEWGRPNNFYKRFTYI